MLRVFEFYPALPLFAGVHFFWGKGSAVLCQEVKPSFPEHLYIPKGSMYLIIRYLGLGY